MHATRTTNSRCTCTFRYPAVVYCSPYREYWWNGHWLGYQWSWNSHKANWTTNFNQIVHTCNYYAVPILIMKSRFSGLCDPHTCLVGLAPMTTAWVQHAEFITTTQQSHVSCTRECSVYTPYSLQPCLAYKYVPLLGIPSNRREVILGPVGRTLCARPAGKNIFVHPHLSRAQ